MPDTDAGVAYGNPQDDARGSRRMVKRHRHRAMWGELYGVVDEVEQHLPQPGLITQDRRRVGGIVGDPERDPLALGRACDEGDGLRDERARRERRSLQHDAFGLDPGVVEDVVDDAGQDFAAHAHLIDATPLPRCEAGIVAQEIAEADDRIQRCAHLVAHRGQELALGTLAASARACAASARSQASANSRRPLGTRAVRGRHSPGPRRDPVLRGVRAGH